MLKHQPWSLGTKAPALCPKCNSAALFRSHTHTTLEEKRKHYGAKRPYRCHSCKWRGWLEESHLRYSTEILAYRRQDTVTEDFEIPDIQLDGDASQEQALPQTARTTTARRPGGTNGSQGPSRSASDAKVNAPEGFGEHGSGAHVVQDENAQTETPGGTEVSNRKPPADEQLPEFDEAGGRPVSQKVPVGFHHHSRHTIKTCPQCGEPSLYRSRSRSLGETIKKKLTIKRPYRCHRCGWRGWLSRGF